MVSNKKRFQTEYGDEDPPNRGVNKPGMYLPVEKGHTYIHVHISCTFITKPVKTNCYTSSPVLHVHDFLYLLQAIHCLNKYIFYFYML